MLVHAGVRLRGIVGGTRLLPVHGHMYAQLSELVFWGGRPFQWHMSNRYPGTSSITITLSRVVLCCPNEKEEKQ